LLDTELLHLAVEDVSPEGDHLVTVLPAEPVPDLARRALGLDIAKLRVEPIAAGPTALRGEDLDAVADLQGVIERHQLPVDLRAAAAVADVGMDVVSEVDGRGAGGQVDNVAARGEHIHPVAQDIAAHRVEELVRVVDAAPDLDQLSQVLDAKLEHPVQVTALAIRLFVAPVSGNAVFGGRVLLRRAHLLLTCPGVLQKHRHVQRLVEVLLGRGNVVVKLTGDGPPRLVDDGKYLIACKNVRHNDPDGAHIKYLIEREPFALHLLPDTVDVL